MPGDKIVVCLIVVTAMGLYIWKGNPGLREYPFSQREAEIAAADPNTLSADELLTRLQSLASASPEDPEPHYFIGNLLRSSGRSEDAIRAYQSALRRDDRHVASLIALADLRTNEEGGIVTDIAAELYERAWRLDTQQVRAGFLSGLSAYQDGHIEEAFSRWDAVAQSLGRDDPARDILSAMISQATQD